MGSGEGSRGGHVIGHTRTGKALYEHREKMLAGPVDRASARVQVMQIRGERGPKYAKALERMRAMDSGQVRAHILARATESARRGDHHHG